MWTALTCDAVYTRMAFGCGLTCGCTGGMVLAAPYAECPLAEWQVNNGDARAPARYLEAVNLSCGVVSRILGLIRFLQL